MISVTIASAFAVSGETPNVSQFHAEEGKLDLEHWDRTERPIVELSGEWLFYPGRWKNEIDQSAEGAVKAVSHFWENDPDLKNSPYGFGTYRLRITGLEPLDIYGLKIMDEVTAYRLYVNDVLVASNGVVASERGAYQPQWRPVQSVYQADENGNAEFIMEIANYDYYRGGFWNPVSIGSVNDIVAESNKEKILDMFLFASIFIVGIINLILFFLYRYRDHTILYFSLFCFCMSMRTLLIGQRLITDIIPDSSWFVLIRLEYLFGYCLLPIFGLFAVSLLDLHVRPLVQKRLFQILLGCAFLLVLFPNSVYTAVLQPYKLLAVMYFLYLTVITVMAAVKKQPSAAIMLLAFSGIIISLVKEVFFGGTVSWLPFATLNFILCFSVITFRKFLNIIHENEILGTKVILDPLTGLFNRNYLMDLKEKDRFAKHGRRETYLLFLDLDGFKGIKSLPSLLPG
jgi:two-component system sensor histidine kinase ChiS